MYLLGHIPVPYSGTYCQDAQYLYPPDGHAATDPNSHCGAWPADVYYGDVDGVWTDETVQNTSSAYPRLHNVPDDGNFDQNALPSDLELAIGRLDFSELPVDSAAQRLTELGKNEDAVSVICANEGRLRAVLESSSPETFSSGKETLL